MITMDAQTWNSQLKQLPDAHILQTWEWGQVKSKFGWQQEYRAWYEHASLVESTTGAIPPGAKIKAAALVLFRNYSVRGLSSGMKVCYIPKGPVLEDWRDTELVNRVLEDLARLGGERKAIFIKIDPDVRIGIGIPGSPDALEYPDGHSLLANMRKRNWRYSDEQIQYAHTMMLDLSQDEDVLLSQMKQKARYNVRLAVRKGVVIRPGTQADLHLLYRMFAETSQRDGFVIRAEDYYLTLWSTFIQAGMAKVFIAMVEDEPVAGMIIFTFNHKGWYLYGMSREIHREKMPNYLLHWETIRWAKASGCLLYDLWGAPDVFHESDPLWGVYRFKDGLGGQVVRHIGAWDLPLRKGYYSLYMRVLPKVLAVMRSRGKSRVKERLMEM